MNAAENSTKLMKVPHNIVLEDRRHLTVFTELGELTIKGEDLHINRLSLEMGELVVDGEIAALSYAENAKPQQGSFWNRVFR